MTRTLLAALLGASLSLAACKKDAPKPPDDEDFNLSDPLPPEAAQGVAPKPAAQEPPPPAPPPLELKARVASVSTAAADIAKGQATFAAKGCTACHKVGGGKLVGPDLKGVTARRSQAWLETMILEPDRMLKEDAVAKELLKTHLVPMPNQGVDVEKELPFILAYLKSVEL